MTRIYLPLTLDALAEYAEARQVPAEVDRFVAHGTDEQDEYLALMSAADTSAALGTDKRVVLVAEVDDIDGPVPRRSWAAVHADIAADADPDEEPGWFAVQEIPALLADVGRPPVV